MTSRFLRKYGPARTISGARAAHAPLGLFCNATGDFDLDDSVFDSCPVHRKRPASGSANHLPVRQPKPDPV